MGTAATVARRTLGNVEMWHWGTWFSGHCGDGSMVWLDDLRGLFQLWRFYDSVTCHQGGPRCWRKVRAAPLHHSYQSCWGGIPRLMWSVGIWWHRHTISPREMYTCRLEACFSDFMAQLDKLKQHKASSRLIVGKYFKILFDSSKAVQECDSFVVINFMILFPGLSSKIPQAGCALFLILVFIQQQSSHPANGKCRASVDTFGEVGWKGTTGCLFHLLWNVSPTRNRKWRQGNTRKITICLW